VAKSELQDAKEDLAGARFFARLGAQRRVEKAEHRLNDLLDESSVGARR
jgi:membrane protein